MAGVEGCEEKRRRRNEQVLSFHNTILHLTQQRVCDCPIVLAPLLTTHPSSTPHCSSKTFSTPLFIFFCPLTPFSSTHLYSPPIPTHYPPSFTHPPTLTHHPHPLTHRPPIFHRSLSRLQAPPNVSTRSHTACSSPTHTSRCLGQGGCHELGIVPCCNVVCLVVMSCAVL